MHDVVAGAAQIRRSGAPVLFVEHVCVQIEGCEVLSDLSLSVSPSELVAVMGPSGSGKSTLLATIAGLRQPHDGVVRIDGDPMWPASARQRAACRLRHVGIVMQFAELFPELTVAENIELPLMLRRVEPGSRCADLLARLGLDGMELRYPGELSGGERQRVAIARALIGDPGLVLADEPTGALDADRTAVVMTDLVTTIRESGAGAVVCTHDRNVADLCDRVLMLSAGALVSSS